MWIRLFVVLGYVCPRQDIMRNGCCNDGSLGIIQYSCETCEGNNCCAIYENCVSCCLHPDKVCGWVVDIGCDFLRIFCCCRRICWKLFWVKLLSRIMWYLLLLLITLSCVWLNVVLVHKACSTKILTEIRTPNIATGNYRLDLLILKMKFNIVHFLYTKMLLKCFKVTAFFFHSNILLLLCFID